MKKIVFFLAMLFVALQMSAQIVLSGKITDTKGQVLPGANIKIENSFRGTFSDANGNYSLSFKRNGNYTIIVSFLGYEKQIKSYDTETERNLNFRLKENSVLSDEVIVTATRAGDKAPLAYTNMDKSRITARNSARDIPFLLQMTPSLVTTSDAGAGIGYTGLSIRGSDISRINVTINGVPLNDPESHGVWWVDIPDFASSLNSIQIQRGVGTSTNGAGAFGANINLQTTELNKKAYFQYNGDAGSFNTLKNSVSFGSGLLKKHFTLDARLSQLHSDGFIDRAYTNMSSYFLSAAYYGKKSMLRFNYFAGHEKTYQSWWGVPKVRLENNLVGMQEYENNWLFSHEQTQHMINSNSRSYNYYTYDNQTDNYWQGHNQLIYSYQFNKNLNFNVVAHFTHGEGYYEQYKKDDKFSNYNLPPTIFGADTITRSDIIRRKWLSNNFYGFTYNLEYQNRDLSLYYGGAWNQYIGGHYGRIIWAEVAQNIPIRYQWYDNTGLKTDFNNYLKANYEVFKGLNLYGDMQFRQIGYKIYGTYDDLRQLKTDTLYNFINPKVGIFYSLNDNNSLYLSYAIAHREPSRNEFRDAEAGKIPKPEALRDLEAGYKLHLNKAAFEANFYYMNYINQLVNTGKINDVGAVVKENVLESYRIGVELVGGFKTKFGLEWNANLTLSRNKINNYTTYIDDWDNGGQIAEHYKQTNISLSPDIIAASSFSYELFKNVSLSLDSKYVGKQYIDNTSNDNRALDAYFVNNLFVGYQIKSKYFEFLKLNLSVNNLFDEMYETNAWAYRYNTGGKNYVEDGYFPQAGRNYMMRISVKF